MNAPANTIGLGQIPVLLRGEPEAINEWIQRWNAKRVLLYVAVIIIGAALFGAAVGCWRSNLQALYAAIKFPLIILLTTLGNALLNAMLAPLLGLNLGLRQSLLAFLLIGFAPVAWIFSQSTESEVAMGALHLIFWLIATYFGMRFLHAGFRNLDANTGGGLKVWVAIFMLVMLQMTTALRPIVGKAESAFLQTEKKFFVSHWMDCLKKANEPKTGTGHARP
ncbi:MAG TPA: hypothetical protein VGK40_00965 [Verrucomicrobiae bacterium]|jgi:hypothetical protein